MSDRDISESGPFGIADLLHSEYETTYNNGLHQIAQGGPIYTCILGGMTSHHHILIFSYSDPSIWLFRYIDGIYTIFIVYK